MEPFEKVLLAGGHANSLGRSNEILELLRYDNSRFDELFRCIFAQDAWVRMRAIDTFEKLIRENPSKAKPYVHEILEVLTKSDQPSVQWHIAQIFAEIELNEHQQKMAITWLMKRIETTDVDWIVSVNAMKTLLAFYKKGSVKAAALLPLFEVQAKHASKSVRKKSLIFISELSSL